MGDKQKDLINLAKSGKISDMYRLIANGADPFIFDEDEKNALQYAIESDPIKAYTLLDDLLLIYKNPAQQEIIKYYTKLAIILGSSDDPDL